VFQVMGPDWISKNVVVKFLNNNKHRKDRKFLISLSKKMTTGIVPTQMKKVGIRNLGFNPDQEIKLDDTKPSMQISSTPIKQHSREHLCSVIMDAPLKLGNKINTTPARPSSILSTPSRTTALVRNLERSEAERQNQGPTLSDLYELVASLSKSIESSHVDTMARLDVMEKVQKDLEKQMSMVTSAIAIYQDCYVQSTTSFIAKTYMEC
jgi:hypothetical protein